jgi:hypothetical protein
LRRRHGRDGCGNLCLQFLQTRVHEGYLPFPPFRLECCANKKLIHVITGRMS